MFDGSLLCGVQRLRHGSFRQFTSRHGSLQATSLWFGDAYAAPDPYVAPPSRMRACPSSVRALSSKSTPVSAPSPTFMDPRDAGQALAGSLTDPGTPVTVADAAAASGLALRDADRGLHWLISEYHGHLRVTESGELLFLFPHRFTKPWETRDRVSRALSTLGRGAVGALRFVVRAWVMVVLLAYVAIFLAVLLGMMFASQNDRGDNRRGRMPGGELIFVLMRVLGDALFWTFHPFSPFAIGYGGYGYRARNGAPRGFARAPKDETPFYEKVNRFFFGPTPPKADPRATERKILTELRTQKGRIGLADVMRVTGLPREEADPLMARLMLDYEGDVGVSEDGGIFYHFESMRKTADESAATKEVRPRAAWDEPHVLAPLTGNRPGTNVLIAALNAFNVIMSLVAIDMNLTLAKLPWLFGRIPLDALPYMGTPIALGVVPLLFSIALFLLPVARAVTMPFKAKRLATEKGRLALLRTVLTRVADKAPVTDEVLADAWKRAAGQAASPKELTRRVVELGGDAEIQEDTGEVRYRFVDLETEAAALEAEREAASEEEKNVGKVIFASDN